MEHIKHLLMKTLDFYFYNKHMILFLYITS